MYYGSPHVAPNETRPTVTKRSTRQRNLCAHSAVYEHRSSPCSDQSTTSDKNKIFHTFYGQVVILCPCEPADHIFLDVFLKYLHLNSIFAEAPMRKRQKCSTTPARISDAIGPARLQLSEAAQDDFYSLFGRCSLDIVGVFISEHTTGAVVYFAESLTTNIEMVEA